MSKWTSLSDIRRDYGSLSLSELNAQASPIAQFENWFAEVLQTEMSDPTAMVLSTVDENGHPDSRVVLLKGIDNETFIFYSNYQSTKAKQLQGTDYAALNFYWPQMARQVRIRGHVTRTSKKTSDAYFLSRPLLSQLGAIVSPQSQEISSREELEQKLNKLTELNQPVTRPASWGGYKLEANEIEFWQGRDNRLHDRIHYVKLNGQWTHHRLAP